MRIAVLGATGLTGRELTTQALARGYQVTALARDPARLQDLACPALTLARANVRDPDSVYAAVEGADALVSGLGVGPCDPPETLVEGARVAVSAGVPRIVWLGALGTGASRGVAGPVFGPLLGWALRRELAAKVEARLRRSGDRTRGQPRIHALLARNERAKMGGGRRHRPRRRSGRGSVRRCRGQGGRR